MEGHKHKSVFPSRVPKTPLTPAEHKPTLIQSLQTPQTPMQLPVPTASNRLETCCFNILSKIENDQIMRKVSEKSKAILMEKCNEILLWVNGNNLVGDEDCELKQKELKRLFNNIIIESYKEVVSSPESVAGFSNNPGIGDLATHSEGKLGCEYPQRVGGAHPKSFGADLIQF